MNVLFLCQCGGREAPKTKWKHSNILKRGITYKLTLEPKLCFVPIYFKSCEEGGALISHWLYLNGYGTLKSGDYLLVFSCVFSCLDFIFNLKEKQMLMFKK